MAAALEALESKLLENQAHRPVLVHTPVNDAGVGTGSCYVVFGASGLAVSARARLDGWCCAEGTAPLVASLPCDDVPWVDPPFFQWQKELRCATEEGSLSDAQ